ncbi:hypothetical protein BLOT_010220 [Blomia tropicalis]|nr:hypothetical protein BLOT_010220 [Blomia tropicalis]
MVGLVVMIVMVTNLIFWYKISRERFKLENYDDNNEPGKNCIGKMTNKKLKSSQNDEDNLAHHHHSLLNDLTTTFPIVHTIRTGIASYNEEIADLAQWIIEIVV